MIFDVSLFIKLSILAFNFVLFSQSGVDKLIYSKGNKAYIQSVFEKTFLNRFSTILFWLITILEVSAGLFCLIGFVHLWYFGYPNQAIIGLELSIISLLCLFFGQRIAKDYTGAASLVGYFLLSVFGLYLFSI